MSPSTGTKVSAETSGMTTADAVEHLRSDSPNELPDQGARSLAPVARDVMVKPILLLLIAAWAI